MGRTWTLSQFIETSLHQKVRCQFRYKSLQNPIRKGLGLHCQKVLFIINPESITMTLFWKEPVIQLLSLTSCWAGEFSSPRVWYGGHYSLQLLPLTFISLHCCSKNTARSCSICAMLARSFTWEEREMRSLENAIKSSILKISETFIIHLIPITYS